MKTRTFLMLIMLVAITAFVALNWSAVTTPTSLSLGVASVDAPFGLVMLGLLVALTVLFLAYVVYLQTSVLREARRHARELKGHRDLADQAEASRFTELRTFIESEMRKLAARDAESHAALLARIEKLDEAMRISMEDSSNTVAAYLGELEDRIDSTTRESPSPFPARRDH